MQSVISSSLDIKNLCELLIKQTNSAFPDGQALQHTIVESSARVALQRLEYCFSKIDVKYFFDGKRPVFDHLNSDQYAMWLYWMSNQLYKDGAPLNWSKKVFLLNKMMHGCDIFYEVELPSIFLLVHPLGAVLGRGVYQDYLMVYQRTSIGSNHNNYPELGKYLTLRPGSSILGDCQVGENVTIAAESLVIDHSLESNTVYFGAPNKHWIRQKNSTEIIWRK